MTEEQNSKGDNVALSAGLCAACRYWEMPEEFTDAHNTGVGRCLRVVMFWDATEWNEEGDGRKFIAGFEDVKAFTQDGSDYKAYLLTKPDFGCVMHEAHNKDS